MTTLPNMGLSQPNNKPVLKSFDLTGKVIAVTGMLLGLALVSVNAVLTLVGRWFSRDWSRGISWVCRSWRRCMSLISPKASYHHELTNSIERSR